MSMKFQHPALCQIIRPAEPYHFQIPMKFNMEPRCQRLITTRQSWLVLALIDETREVRCHHFDLALECSINDAITALVPKSWPI
jgi:hypothetical protein